MTASDVWGLVGKDGTVSSASREQSVGADSSALVNVCRRRCNSPQLKFGAALRSLDNSTTSFRTRPRDGGTIASYRRADGFVGSPRALREDRPAYSDFAPGRWQILRNRQRL